MQRRKKGEVDGRVDPALVDPTLPLDPFKDPNLEDVTHEEARKTENYKFEDKRTGEVLEYDKGKPGKPGHGANNHYHRPNPNTTGKRDYYLDAKGNPVPKGSELSHLYPSTK